MPLNENKGKIIKTDPKTDLTVVCANYHRMIHKKKGITLTVEELREKLKKVKSN
jgi:5-methylcytosine-specific restriction protein A